MQTLIFRVIVILLLYVPTSLQATLTIKGPLPYLEAYKLKHDRYPTNEEWQNLEIPLDPWGYPYQYQYPGLKNPSSFDLLSTGPDGVISEDDIPYQHDEISEPDFAFYHFNYGPYQAAFFILWILSLIHVYRESKRLNEAVFIQTVMVAVCFWPLGYLFWIFLWPGTLRRFLTGKKRLEPTLPYKFSARHNGKA